MTRAASEKRLSSLQHASCTALILGRARVLNERGADPSPLQSSRPEVCGFAQHREGYREGAIGRSGEEENVELDDVARIVRYIGIGVSIAVLLCKDHGRRDRPGGRSPAATRTCSRSNLVAALVSV